MHLEVKQIEGKGFFGKNFRDFFAAGLENPTRRVSFHKIFLAAAPLRQEAGYTVVRRAYRTNVLVCVTRTLATGAGALGGDTRTLATGASAGALLRASPIPPGGLVQGRRGSCDLALPNRTPPLCSPHGCAPRRRPRGQPRAASPSDSSLPGAARKIGVVGSYLYLYGGLRSAVRFAERLHSRP